jgi:hypothetical protein
LCYMPRPYHTPRLDYSNYTWWRVQITKLLVMPFSRFMEQKNYLLCSQFHYWTTPRITLMQFTANYLRLTLILISHLRQRGTQ